MRLNRPLAATLALIVLLLLYFVLKKKEQLHVPESAVKTLSFVDKKVGTGDLAMVGKIISIHYTASVFGGKQFDNTYDKNAPMTFRLGNGETIAGFEQGIPGMKVGGIRVITMPPDMGFGRGGTSGALPLNTALVYEVELLESKAR